MLAKIIFMIGAGLVASAVGFGILTYRAAPPVVAALEVAPEVKPPAPAPRGAGHAKFVAAQTPTDPTKADASPAAPITAIGRIPQADTTPKPAPTSLKALKTRTGYRPVTKEQRLHGDTLQGWYARKKHFKQAMPTGTPMATQPVGQ